jgi:predicted enzyme related to lactoylglutathione lyase
MIISVLGTIRQVVVPVDDVESAIPYYRDELGLPLKFQDGARWAAFALGELTLALAGPGEQPAGAEDIALGVKVEHLERAIEAVLTAGGTKLSEPRTGEHERRATVRDRFGTPIALYEPLAD